MSTQRELLEQSLVALKDSSELVSEWGTYADDYSKNKYGLSDDIDKYNRLIDELEAELAKPEQEPAWLAVEDGNETRFFNPDMIDYAKDFNRPITKLYTSPPQYEPLSDDEIGRLLPGRPAIDTFTGLFIVNQQFLIDFAHNIEKRITDGKS